MYIFSGGMVLGVLFRSCRDVAYNGNLGECMHSNADVRRFFSETHVERYMMNDMMNVTVCLCSEDKCNDMHFKLVTPQQSYQTIAMSPVSTETDPGVPLSEVDMEYAALTESTEADVTKSENNIVRAVNCNTIKGIVVHFFIAKYCITGLFN